MKIDRLIGILSILLQEEKTTAPELAERFEVSRRTINRDIEDLCKAGIPIRTAQGTGGGISIMDGYRMDRTILTSKDMQMILAGLRSLDSVSGSSYYSQRYGNAYELPSPKARELTEIFQRICMENGILSSPEDCFRFMSELPEKYPQMSIFDL